MDFHLLQMRLVAHIRERVRSGELTERGLAHLTGVSQPHIHNVLKGTRLLSTNMADQILRKLNIDLWDLIDPGELPDCVRPKTGEIGGYRGVPVLEGRLGPGHPFPSVESRWERYPFPSSLLTRVELPVVVRLGADTLISSIFRANDMVLLDRSEAKRREPDAESYYALEQEGEGLIRLVTVGARRLYLRANHSREDIVSGDYVSLLNRNILDVVKAKVVWMSRHLESFPLATPPTEEAG